jgi:glycolate oxidase iron-sulfur subunit
MLRACGFDLVPFREKDLCCGSAGAYSMLNPELSVRVRDRKAAAIEDSGAEMIASANIGCMTHIGQGTRLPILHVIELVDWATGGPRPTALKGGAGQDV